MTLSELIDKYYPEEKNVELRHILLIHSKSVANKALNIAKRKKLPLTEDEITTAAMVHDIGIVETSAPSIYCFGDKPYICHGIVGAEMLRKEGFDEKYARIAERHTGAGITVEDIEYQKIPLPLRDFLPETLLERLICYADKFYSKTKLNDEKDIHKILKSLSKFDVENKKTTQRFLAMHKEFSD